MRRSEILEYLKRNLTELIPVESSSFKVSVHREGREVDAILNLQLRAGAMEALCEVVAQPNLARIHDVIRDFGQWKAKKHTLFMVVAPYLTAEMKRACRSSKIAYLDLSGNVWIDHSRILIDKEASTNRFPSRSQNRNPFADKASLVLRYLLGRPDHTGGVRKIAEAVGLDPGYVSRIGRAARDAGYADIDRKKRIHLKNETAMLSDWTSFYHWRKNRSEQYFHLFGKSDEVLPSFRRALGVGARDYAVGLHAGANLIDRYSSFPAWHIYVRNEDPIGRLDKALELRKVEEGGNIILLRPYYRSSAFYGTRSRKGLQVVSDLQLYLDLVRFPVRGQEVAEKIYRSRLRSLVEGVSDGG